MSALKVEAEAAQLGFDARRLARIDDHFQRYVDEGRLPGFSVAVARRGRVAHVGHRGLRNVEAGLPVTEDTIFRIYSMTKPITSVAALLLWEQGRLDLNDPIDRYIPEFADTRVYRAGPALAPGTDPPAEPIRVWHLLTHTSGLTYGFHHSHAVDEIYRNAGYDTWAPEGKDLAGVCADLARLPLVFQPGTEWNYGMSVDVLGRVVEVVAGQPLDVFFAEHILGPLGMTDTAFWAGPDDRERLAELYVAGPGGRLVHSPLSEAATVAPLFLAGGGGLVSTLHDYHRFVQMLVRGGELDGARILSPRTVAYATRNHLPGNADLDTFGRPVFAESAYQGVGFGLGFSVVLDPVPGKGLTNAGEYAWGGLASTAFYVDPVEEITAVFLTQLMPSSTYPIRPQLRLLVNAALVD